MCLYPKLIKNRKYRANKKNGGQPPQLWDKRLELVPVGCGKCIECKKQLANQWRVRLNEENKQHKNKYFVTLTFSEEHLDALCAELKHSESNAVAGIAVRRFLERWRKRYKKSCRHWLITELGHEGTERIHLHGIIYTDHIDKLEELWKYGNIWIGEYVSERTVNYIIKYVTKVDTDHKGYQQQIFSSPGIGNGYTQTYMAPIYHKYRPGKTKDFYKLPNGYEIGLPIYYRNKLFTEEERELLWIERQEMQKRYVLGTEIDMTRPGWLDTYNKMIRTAREFNKRIGYGSTDAEWNRSEYSAKITRLMRLHEANKKK